MIKNNRLRRNNERKIVYCIIGRAYSGKHVLVKKFCEEYGFSMIRPYTTREKMPGENEYNSEYTFTNSLKMINTREKIVEAFKCKGDSYFITEEQLICSDFHITNPLGLSSLKRNVDSKKIKLVEIIILSDKDLELKRATNRLKIESEFLRLYNKEKYLYEKEEREAINSREVYIVRNNKDLDTIVNKVYSIVESECK